MKTRIAILATALLCAACISPDTPPVEVEARFQADQFFAGETRGEGVLLKRSGKIDRSFDVVSHGEYDEQGRFILRQAINWSDGTQQARTFVLRPDGRGRLVGGFADGWGQVVLTMEGSTGLLRHKLPGVPFARIEQRLELLEDGVTVENAGVIRVLGWRVRELEETITKAPR